MFEELRQELPCALLPGLMEEIRGRGLLDYAARVHEHDAIGG